MKLTGLDGESMEITRAQPSADDGIVRDRLVVIAVQLRGFAGQTKAWVLHDAWFAFLEDLARLERARHGAASFESISPDELRISFGSIDGAGHLAAEGFVGVRTGSHATKLTFSAMRFEPTELPRVLRELKAL